MLINHDFTELATVKSNEYNWHSTPQRGVERVILDRIGDEIARATSLVRFHAGASYPRHTHGGGEEILVLSGTFSEGDKDYPAGYYLRNPPGSEHQPYSKSGAVIFVKLRQMSSEEKCIVRVNTRNRSNWTGTHERPVCHLFNNRFEDVYVQRFSPNYTWRYESERLTELFVLTGEIKIEGEDYTEGSWVRFPASSLIRGLAGQDGVMLFIKHYELTEMQKVNCNEK